jgi:NAD(P)-dependent dehydrogenase (short-subunit alcohol dehydrogenase family)
MSDSWEDKVALVIGATSGIGAATAVEFASRGVRVMLAARRPEAAESVIAEIREAGGIAHFHPADVTDAESMTGVVEQCIKRWGRLDFSFNNAGWEGTGVATADIAEADWKKMMDIKLNGTWRAMKAQLRYMQDQQNGAIVNMAGSWGLVGFPSFSSYCAAAHGVVGLTRASAMEYARSGIRINAVCPGAVDAPMLDRMVENDEAAKRQFGDSLPIGRIAAASEVAAAVVWLCSADSSYLTGHALPLTGGA